MTDLSKFDPNAAGNPNNTIFGLPFSEEDARLVVFPVPWEVTVSCRSGAARCADAVFRASLHVDLFDADVPGAWRKGYFMRAPDKKILMKNDYLRREAELYMDYVAKEEEVCDNKFMNKSLKEINAGSEMLNQWVYEQTKHLLTEDKLVVLLGGDHSSAFGFYKALAEKYGKFGILQIDAHCDLRKAFNGFVYSNASIMFNALEQIPEIEKLVQMGIREYCEEEWNYICGSQNRVVTFFEEKVKESMFEGETWGQIADKIVKELPQLVYISFDVDGLDPKLCPNTGTPAIGGFQSEQVLYLFKKITESGRKIIGFDLVEIGVGEGNTDANVAARLLWKMCNLMIKTNCNQ
jgi:agmatinase